MEKFRLLEIAYESLSEHEPLRQAIIGVRNQQGRNAINTVMIFTVKRPCVQLGEFQDIDEELHIQECRQYQVDISRRM